MGEPALLLAPGTAALLDEVLADLHLQPGRVAVRPRVAAVQARMLVLSLQAQTLGGEGAAGAGGTTNTTSNSVSSSCSSSRATTSSSRRCRPFVRLLTELLMRRRLCTVTRALLFRCCGPLALCVTGILHSPCQ